MKQKPNGHRAETLHLHCERSGFALVITLSLLVLLSILVVGLLSLSSVSLRSASASSAQQQARANARMALMMAIGQLQREMGPDSRISAPHDAGTTTGGMPRWTAVYDAWTTNPANPSAALAPASRVRNLRTWLVSGANGTSVSTGERIPLVGAKSLGANQTTGDLVSAPLIALSDPGKIGRIAWWTADESTKAKINAGAATDSFAAASNPFSDAQSPPRVGQKAVPSLGAFDWKTGQRAIAVSTDAVNLAAGLSGAGIGHLNHDVTVHSTGVLSDVREGRLKRDLSNLLTRNISEVEDKPLYLADGRLNRFVIAADGSITNAPGTPANRRASGNANFSTPTADDWGINLEELFLFHNLHREIQWTGNTPRIVSKSTRELAVDDRFFLYRQPVIDAAQFILSLRAVPDPAGTPVTPAKFKMQMMLDGMVAVSNPNDIAFEYAPGLQLALQLLNIPYRITWDIRRGGTALPIVQPAPPSNLEYFRGYVGGGPAAANAAGFSLLPGESGVFGSTTGTGFILNLQRGFVPSGGIQMNETDYPLQAGNLLASDTISFRMDRINSLVNNNKYTAKDFGANVWTYCNFWLGPRAFGGRQGWHLGAIVPHGTVPLGITPAAAFVDQRFPPIIQPSEALPVSDFVIDSTTKRPKPFLMMSFLRNVEQESGTGALDAFNSRSHLMSETSNSLVGMSMGNLSTSSHISQSVIKAEQLPYRFSTLAAGVGGRNLYQGGSRQINRGGSLFVIKRRTPLAPPLSLGAFENAIASGFARRFRDAMAIGNGTDPFPSTARALCGEAPATPVVSKAIGNSYASPFIAPGQIYQNFSSPSGGTDHSWMVNNALWDSWFLSGIVDGRGLGGNPFQTDGRSPRAQFSDLANNTGLLRNRRFVFYPFRSPDTALSELFTGDLLKPSAINDLSRYLLIDGAFNVNSTSQLAWKALLSSLRDQELIVNGGTRKKFGNPYGTLGYAQDDTSTNDWTGLRDLTEPDIDALAGAIVTEVKARGPFLNLGDFVNRRPNGSSSEQAVGALQAAIDKSGLNNRFTGAGRSAGAADFGTLSGANAISSESAPARAAGSAGHLTQARLLTALGPQITVRSDTFLIRTYGDVRDASNNILAKAWCEAVVQRVPDYVDPTDSPEAAEGWPAPTNKLTTANALFGRRIEIRSFRWLSADEI